MQFRRNTTNGLISLSIPEAFKEAIYAGTQQNPGVPHYDRNYMPPIIQEMPEGR